MTTCYERISGRDTTFLAFETPETPQHISTVQIFEAGPLCREDGSLDFDAYRAAISGVLHRIPRYRQKLDWTPIEKWPIWIDDADFDIEQHLHHVALPRPGDDRQLRDLASRVMSLPLDRKRPLWEVWVVEGLDGNRFALITKVHHCMLDGVSGMSLAEILYSTTPEVEIAEPVPYLPRPRPSRARLLRDQALRLAELPLQAAGGLRRTLREARSPGQEIWSYARALGELVGTAFDGASETPLNGELDRQRRFDWWTTPLEELKQLRRRFGCTLNDLVLAIVTGAVRRYLLRRGIDPSGLRFRVSAPVSMHGEGEKQLRNNISSWIVELPIGESDPQEQLRRIHARTQELKKSRSALGIELFMRASDYLPVSLVGSLARIGEGQANAIVSNIPGPPFPLYLLGSRMLGMYGQAPLLSGMGLGLTAVSYDGKLCWGFTADALRVPDLRDLVEDMDVALKELANATQQERPDPRRRRPRREP